MEASQSQNSLLKASTTTTSTVSTGSNLMPFSSSINRGYFADQEYQKKETDGRKKRHMEEERLANCLKLLQCLKLNQLDIGHKSLFNANYKTSLNKDILLPVRTKYSQLQYTAHHQVKCELKNNRQSNRKLMTTIIPHAQDVTRIGLIEFIGKPETRMSWPRMSNNTVNVGRSTPPGYMASIKGQDEILGRPVIKVNDNFPTCILKKEPPQLGSQSTKKDGEEVVECFTYYANTILPRKHGSPEESELSNGIIKEINQLYLKYKNFNILEDDFEQIRSNIIRNLNKRKFNKMKVMQQIKFTCLEDCILLVAFETQNLKEFSSPDYNMISYFLPWRSEKVLKRRLDSLLRPVNFDFTIAEDRLLLKAVEILGQNWKEISRLMRREKTRAACRSRFNFLQKILKKQSSEEWHQKLGKRKCTPMALMGQIMKIFCTFSYIICNWELVKPLGIFNLSIDNPLTNENLKHYLRTLELPVVIRANESFINRMRPYLELITAKRNYAYDRMKFERKIPQSWAAAIHLRKIDLKPVWEIESPSRFELAVFYHYHYNYAKAIGKKRSTSRSMMPNRQELLNYPELKNIANQETVYRPCPEESAQPVGKKTLKEPQFSTLDKAMLQRDPVQDAEESEEDCSDSESSSEWETLSDEESSSEGESISDTGTVSDWDSFSDTETCSDSEEAIESDSISTSSVDDNSHVDLTGLRVSVGNPAKSQDLENEETDDESQIIFFRNVQLTEEIPLNSMTFQERKQSSGWLNINNVDNEDKLNEMADPIITDSSDVRALDLVLLDHDYCQSYTYIFKNSVLNTTSTTLDICEGLRQVPYKCFQNVKQQVTKHNVSLQTTTEGKRYRKRAHRVSQTPIVPQNL